MHGLIINSALFYFIISVVDARFVKNELAVDRNNFLKEETKLSLGGHITLTQDEEKANEILMHLKRKEVDESFANPEHYNFSKHFFTYRNDISKSKVYQIVRKMPKGAALHIHASMMLDADSLLELTYEDHLYACYGNDSLQLRFAKSVPSQSCPFEWSLLNDLRYASDDVTAFDLELRKHLTLYTDDPQLMNEDINRTWNRFNKVYRAIKSVISYRPVREKYFYRALKNFYKDNVMYIEIRSGLSGLYELNGTVHDGMYLASLYQKITEDFIEKHPDFIGVKLIVTSGRWKNVDATRLALDKAKKLKENMPDFIAGFDLVGQEDLGKPLEDFLPDFIEAKDELDFYFHGGETNWFGMPTDENLLDAVLLGSKRVGHAYALMKHPMILAAVNEKDIALEVNVISNVVLSLVRDVRNHPLASYLALGLPVVLSSDDPGAWDADPLSHDFYVAFVGVASRHADIRMLKQLALNSIKYSALDDAGKRKLLRVLTRRWDLFIEELISNDGQS